MCARFSFISSLFILENENHSAENYRQELILHPEDEGFSLSGDLTENSAAFNCKYQLMSTCESHVSVHTDQKL